MFMGDPFLQALVIITLLTVIGAILIYCWDIWVAYRYCFYRHCSCQRRAEKVIVPQALVTTCPVTVECRVITPQIADIV